jgi:2-methylcitrate dehydratase
MARGLNHALQLSMSVAAGTAKLLGLGVEQTANAIAAAATDNVSLATVHAEPVSNWKSISPASTGVRAVYATMLAARGVTGPRSLFEGPHGLVQLFDRPIDLSTTDRRLTCVEQTCLKQYCALIHGQVVIDAILALRTENDLRGDDVARVTLEVFQGAYDFAGGGAYGPKDDPRTKEQADYNLKYLSAVALLDGGVGPEQLETERVLRARRAGPVDARRRQAGRRPDSRLSAAHGGAGAPGDPKRAGIRPRAGRLRGIADPAHVVGTRRGQVSLAGRTLL